MVLLVPSDPQWTGRGSVARAGRAGRASVRWGRCDNPRVYSRPFRLPSKVYRPRQRTMRQG